jgi:hypothetical protein
MAYPFAAPEASRAPQRREYVPAMSSAPTEGPTIVDRSRFAAAVLTGALILAGCSGGGSDEGNAVDDRTTTTSTSTTTTTTTIDLATVDTAKVDTIIGAAILGTQLLALPSGSSPEVLAAYTQAAELFAQQARALREGIGGVPKGTTRVAADAFVHLADVTRARVICLRSMPPSATPATACADETEAATNAGFSAGAALVSLIPYGTRSHEEVSDAIDVPPS